MDFVSDQTASGQRFRGIGHIGVSIRPDAELSAMIAEHGADPGPMPVKVGRES